ncbi:MAG: PASTA domain-containing protein [Cetobacterium sp.]|uniref:PASTA domain-containing protein n=1 Tax=unclassified Cetobacterium TaxID=2630983 RepID=UPI00163C9BD3|nr:PASTA domain-containing protein [Cetobacterium sp. 2A]MBC2856666.1 PASTA domain-containing protein [Cetobacterium sp. 2A]
MKKISLYLLSFCAIIASCFFAYNIFIRIYFNQFLYKTPDFKGLTLQEVKQLNKGNVFNITIAGEEFSTFPTNEIFLQEPEPNKIVKRGRNIKIWVSKGSDELILPDFSEKNLIDVTAALQTEGITIDKVSYLISPLPYNTVIATSPAKNSKVRRGDSISILVGDIQENKEVKMPDLIGLELEDAKSEISRNSLSLGEISYKVTDYLDPNIVIETSQTTGKKITAGTAIDLVVSQ